MRPFNQGARLVVNRLPVVAWPQLVAYRCLAPYLHGEGVARGYKTGPNGTVSLRGKHFSTTITLQCEVARVSNRCMALI
jgi:hypothetical protein